MKLACLGDSLTAAYEIDPASCWTNLTANELEITIDNFGIPGDTTGGMLSRLSKILNENKYTHVIVYGGTNDLYMSLSHQQIIANIVAMTRQIKHAGMTAIIGIPSQLYLEEGMASIFLSNESLVANMLTFRKQLLAHAQMDEQLAFDFDPSINQDALMEDRVHYNTLGHEMISRDLTRFLKGLII